MATTTSNISLTKPEATDTTLIREDINNNSDIIDGRFSSVYLAIQAKAAVSITGGSITGITDLAVADGGTGSSTASNARTALGLAIGTNVQAYDAALTSISGLAYVSASFIKLSANDTYVVRTIAETKTDLSLNAVENTALSTWVGTTNITTLGTIATGVWSGTVIGAAKGGTGVANNALNTITFTGNFTLGLTLTANTAITLPTSGTLVNSAVATLSSLTSIGTITTGGLGTGAVIAGVTMTLGTDAAFDTYYRGASVLTRLAPNTAASNKFLRMIGTGTAGQAPSWEALGTGDIPDISATYSVLAGNTSLITLGTVTTGTWTATTIKANYLQSAAADLGAANIEVVLSNTNGAYVTNLTTDGTITATVGFAGALTGNVTGNCSGTAATVTGAAQASITSLGTLTTLTIDDITINANSITSAGASTLSITPTAGQVITFDGTITLDAGVITGATSITSTAFVGALTGNADTVTGFTPASGSLTLAGADALTLTTSAATNVTLPTTGTLATTSNKLSAFAATTSAELAGVISDEIGAGKLRFDTSVTTKTTTATLTEAEAGTILVSAAGGAYTVTLPTASGNTGLTYHFIKTDANYTLITLAANGAETFNYENSTGAPVATYARLNTYCAEVTVVSDGSNWQVIQEELGQIPKAYAFLTNPQLNISSLVFMYVAFDTEDFDIGSNFNIATWYSGTTTSASASKLIDSGANFSGNLVGRRVKNTTDTTETYITAIDSTTQLSVRDDIFASGENYEIKNAKFVVPIPGYYEVRAQIMYSDVNVVIDKNYDCRLFINTTQVSQNIYQPTVAEYMTITTFYSGNLSINDEITFKEYNKSGVNTIRIFGESRSQTYITIKLISKS